MKRSNPPTFPQKLQRFAISMTAVQGLIFCKDHVQSQRQHRHLFAA